jgi:hypothetical protein
MCVMMNKLNYCARVKGSYDVEFKNITVNVIWSVNTNNRVLFPYNPNLSDVHRIVFASTCQTSNMKCVLLIICNQKRL